MEVDKVTEKTIGCAFAVSNTLGAGFLEKVYENALVHELRKYGLRVEQQHCMEVKYDGIVVGDYVADVLVENTVLVELKAVKALDEIHMAQMHQLSQSHRTACMPPVKLWKTQA